MAEYLILTDATCDLSEEVIEKLDITVIPMEIEMGGQSHISGPKHGNLSVQEFYSRQQKGENAKTSQITPSTYVGFFEHAAKNGKDVVLICLSSGLSASYGASKVAAEKVMKDYPDRKIYCIDSLSATLGEGLLVCAAARKRQEGLSAAELAAWLEEHRKMIVHCFTVDELETLKRGGRVSAATAAIGSMLNIKPILVINEEGKIVPSTKVRGRKKSLEVIAEMFLRKYQPIEGMPAFIGYGTALEDAKHMKDLLVAGGRVGADDVVLGHVGPVVGAHTGQTIIAVLFFGNAR